MLSIFKPGNLYGRHIRAAKGFDSEMEMGLYAVLFFFFLSLYVPKVTWLYNVAMWLIFVYSFLMNSLCEKKMMLFRRPELWLMMLFFLLNGVSALLSANQTFGIHTLGKRLSLL